MALGSAACSSDPDSSGSTGGTTSTNGGSSTGGTTQGQGGTSSATGGSTTQTGGATTGGAAAGGSGTTGGSSASGGSTTSAGNSSTGGATSSGGAANTGGTPGGGATSGGAPSGGTTATGGSTATGGTPATGGAAGAGGTNTGGSSTTGGASGTILDQTGNPLTKIVSGYTGWLSTAADAAAKLTADKTFADNIITWQMPHGGWFKYGKTAYAAPWNGTAPRADWKSSGGTELGTIDNSGTVTEIMVLADVYRRSTADTKYRDSARKGLDFLLTMQAASGGFPQVYPARGNYSDYVTFNDDAMVRVLGMLDLAAHNKAPFTADTFSADQLTKITTAISKATQYILKAQIVQGSVKTVWCAQHDPTSYAAKGARSYELASKSGSESIGVIGFLLSQPQTADVKAAAQAAIAWYKSDAVKVANTGYVSRPSGNTDDAYNPIQTKAGSTMWYRFYDLDKDTGFFSGRLPTDDPPGVGKKYNIMDIEAERRYGYQWGGSYGTNLFAYTDKIGY